MIWCPYFDVMDSFPLIESPNKKTKTEKKTKREIAALLAAH